MASRFWVGGTGTWDASDTTHWSATSGGAGGASVPVDGDTVTFDGSSGGGTVTLGYNPTVTSITCGAFTGTLDFSTFSPTMDTFNCSGTGVRTLTMTNMGTMTLRGNNATILNFSTITNLTFNRGGTIDLNYSGSTGTRTITPNTLTLPNIKVSAGSDTFTSSTASPVYGGDLNFTGFTGTWSNASGTPSIGGNFTLGTGMTVTSGSGAITLNPSSGPKTITSNGVQINKPITINATAGVTVQLADDLNMDGASARTLGLTQGTFDANNKNVTCGIFSSSNSNTRTLTMGSGTWTLTGNAATIWTTATTTNLTLNSSASTVINCTYAGAVGTRVISIASGTTPYVGTINVPSGTDIFNFGGSTVGNLNYTGFAGSTTNSGTISFTGNLTFGSHTSYTGNFTVAGTSGTQVITSSGCVTPTSNFTFNGVGGTFQLADNFTTAGTATLTNGTLNLNNKNFTSTTLSSSNSNVRVITLGSGTVTLTGTGTVWNTGTTTNLTLNRGTSTIKISDTSATAKTFSGGGLAYYNLWYANGAGGASLTFVGSNTFNSVRDTSTAAHSLIFTAGTTQTVPIGSWFVTGKSGAVTTLASTTTSAFTLTFTGVGTISSDYMSISYCTISLPDKEFFVGTHSTDGGNNTRVYFTAPTLHRSNFYLFM